MMKTVLIFWVVILSVFTFQGGVARATPSADLTYIETFDGVWWQYDYTLFNTSDPVADAGFDLYELFLSFNQSVLFKIITLPSEWIEISGPGFIQTFSIMPGLPPDGADIAPGASLGGFSFQFSEQVGRLTYEVTLANPNDWGNPLVLPNGVYDPAPAPVPEPATMLLIGTGLAGWAGLRRRLKK